MTEKPMIKFALVLDKHAEPAELLAATWQATQRIIAAASDEQRKQMQFLDYRDASGGSHAPISALPLVVLRGKGGDIRKALAAAEDGGGAVLSAAIPGTKADTWATALFFGPREAVDAITRRFSLWST